MRGLMDALLNPCDCSLQDILLFIPVVFQKFLTPLYTVTTHDSLIRDYVANLQRECQHFMITPWFPRTGTLDFFLYLHINVEL